MQSEWFKYSDEGRKLRKNSDYLSKIKPQTPSSDTRTPAVSTPKSNSNFRAPILKHRSDSRIMPGSSSSDGSSSSRLNKRSLIIDRANMPSVSGADYSKMRSTKNDEFALRDKRQASQQTPK